ncbi:MAG TPA: NADH-quinone oxidoreductase subunit NuoG [Spongiibacteraceae bacterium]|nr:NADH-quinone oxidoreductase subunit NuoG [Spongiibacteraceae bacterium]
MATIHVDGKDYEVDGADNLLRACLSLGLDIPYFCWHPALGSVGACRQCAVKQYANADDKRGRLVMSCMTPAADNTYISIDDEEAKAFRESVVEWLMTNHPHDCPVCEEGGHCHLQDMTVMTKHATRRYRFTKRTHQNQDLGPFINHEMNRCIACYRCVRYYKDYADGSDLGVYGAHDNVYFGRAESGTLESEFSGNLVEVCPTGVFTDKTHSERYNRKWDMQFAPSICQQCAVGCNVSPGERYGELRRIENRYNGDVNRYFLCDRGRFGYGYVNRKDRPRQPWARKGASGSVGDSFDIVTTATALASSADALRLAKRAIGIGSPRASIEANYVLREVVGADNFYSGIAANELARIRLVRDILQRGPARTPTLREIEEADAVFVLGEDVTQTAARIALALRQAAKGKRAALAAEKKIFAWQAEAIANIGQSEKNPVFVASAQATRLDDIAEQTYHAAAEDIARLGFAVAHAIDSSAPAVSDLPQSAVALAQHIANALLAAKKPLIVSGTGAASEAVLQAAANVSAALHAKQKAVGIVLAVPEANSLGLALLGGDSADAALQALSDGQADVVVILENDLYRRADKTLVDAALAAARNVIVVDHQRTSTAEKANVLLPAATFAEGDGTLISNEGRAQRFFQVYDPVYYEPSCQIKESWRWLHALHMAAEGREVSWTQLDEVTQHCASAIPALQAIVDAAPDANYRVNGLKVAREPHRYSGRTAMRANISVHEPRAPQDQDTALAFSMEGHNGTQVGDRPGSLIPFAWAPGWNSPQSWNKFQDEVGGHLRAGDPGVRMIEPAAGAAADYYGPAPAAFSARSDALRVVALQHLFGSEELSARAEPVQKRMQAAYVSLAASDAARLGVQANDTVKITAGESVFEVIAQISAELASGTVGVPQGFDDIGHVTANSWVQLVKGAAV